MSSNSNYASELQQSRLVWLQDEENAWIPAKVILSDNESKDAPRKFELLPIDGKISEEQGKIVEVSSKTSIQDTHYSSVALNYSNLVLLEEFSEGAILHQIRKRYSADEIYTSIGNILVSVNPFKQLSLYTAKVLHTYKDPYQVSSLPPHVYGVSCMAYWSMLNEDLDQAIVISGESGSGKTETTKLVLQYLSDVAGSESRVEQQIMLSNPILEAFGNSKTLRNNNSSRFGKWMEIQFDERGMICGAKIANYLLEKSRVVSQARGERSYHSFYQLCSGATQEFRQKYHIGPATTFNYLSQSGCFLIDGVNDATEYEEVLSAMERLSFPQAKHEQIFRIIAAILHLGNIGFQEQKSDTEASEVSNRDQLNIAAKVLGLDSSDLESALCVRTVVIKNEVQKIKLKVEQALDFRDSLAKDLYGTMFDWMVVRINDFLSRVVEYKGTIGILDIFGFEVFEKNSFEQFCINFANEKLQEHFNQYIFMMEQNEYIQEGLTTESVCFVDNSGTLNLISSIIDQMDEEVVVPKGSDMSLVEKMNKTHCEGKSKNPAYAFNKTNKSEFMLKHYAGTVTYDVNGFIDKTRDSIHDSLVKAMRKSSIDLVQDLFAEQKEDVQIVTPSPNRSRVKSFNFSNKESPNGLLSAGLSPSGLMSPTSLMMISPRSTRSNSTGSSGKSRKVRTLGSKFRTQLDSLMINLQSNAPNFIRCIKPNSQKVKEVFDSKMVLQQMKYAGLFETIRVRASGFAYRKQFDSFYLRYRCLLSRLDRSFTDNMHNNMLGRVESLMRKLFDSVKDKELLKNIKIGKTKVFYRPEVLIFLESKRDNLMFRLATILQSRIRTILSGRVLTRLRKVNAEAELVLKSGDSNEITRILKFAEELRVKEYVEKQLNEAHAYLVEEARVFDLLNQALNTKDFNLLNASILQAKKIKLEVKTKRNQVKQAYMDAIKERERLEKLELISESLDLAMAGENIASLRTCIEEGKKYGIPNEQLVAAQQLVDEILRENGVFENLAKIIHSQSCDPPVLEKAMAEAQVITRQTQERVDLISSGTQKYQDLARQGLLKAVRQQNKDAINDQLSYIEVKKLSIALVTEVELARSFLKELEMSEQRRMVEAMKKKRDSEVAAGIKKNKEEEVVEEALRMELIAKFKKHTEEANLIKESKMSNDQEAADLLKKKQDVPSDDNVEKKEAADTKLSRKMSEVEVTTTLVQQEKRPSVGFNQIQTREADTKQSRKMSEVEITTALVQQEKRASVGFNQIQTRMRNLSTESPSHSSRRSTVTSQDVEDLENVGGRAISRSSSILLLEENDKLVKILMLLEKLEADAQSRKLEEVETRSRKSSTSSDSKRLEESDRQKKLREEKDKKLQEIEQKKKYEEQKQGERIEHFKNEITKANRAKDLVALVRIADDLSVVPRYHKLESLAREFIRRIADDEKTMSELETCVDMFDREGMRQILEANPHMAESDSVSEARLMVYGMSDKEFFQLQFNTFLERHDDRGLKKILAMAPDMGIKDSKIMLAKVLISTKQHAYRNMIKAPTSKQKELRNDEIRQYFSTIGGTFSLGMHSQIRPVENYSKKLFSSSKSKAKESMFIWQDTPIPRSLFKLSTEYCGGRAKSKQIKGEARDLFRNVLGFMRDTFHPYPNTLAQEIIKSGFEEPLLRDEIFCQLIKQTTDHPSEKATCLGWKLIYMCLMSFGPTQEDTKKCLLSHIARIANPIISRMLPIDTVMNISTNCFLAYEEMANECKQSALSLDSITQIADDNFPAIKLYTTTNEKVEIIPGSIFFTARDAVEDVMRILRLDAVKIVGSLSVLATTDPEGDFQGQISCYEVSDMELLVGVYEHWERAKRMGRIVAFRLEVGLVFPNVPKAGHARGKSRDFRKIH